MLQVCSRSLTTRNESLPRAYGVSTVLLVARHMPDPHSLPLTEKHRRLLRIDRRHHCHCTNRRRHHHHHHHHHLARVNSHLQQKGQLFLQIGNQSQYPAHKCLQASSKAEGQIPLLLDL